jgi:hypothetical protein
MAMATDVGRCTPATPPVPVDVARQSTSEPIAVLVKLRLRIDGHVNVSEPAVFFNGVAGFGPMALDSQWRPLVRLPRQLVGWDESLEVLQRDDERVPELVAGHKAGALTSTAGASSVISGTWAPDPWLAASASLLPATTYKHWRRARHQVGCDDLHLRPST